MFAIIGAGGLLGAIFAAPLRRRLAARTIIVGEYWLLVGVVPILLVARGVVLIGLLVAAGEFATPLTNSVIAGSRVAVTPDDLQGRVQAASTMLAMSLAWLGPLAVGFAFENTTPTTTVLMVGGWVLAVAVVATLAPALRAAPVAAAADGARPDDDLTSDLASVEAPSHS
jgi:hypothetical protein